MSKNIYVNTSNVVKRVVVKIVKFSSPRSHINIPEIIKPPVYMTYRHTCNTV